MKPNDFSKFDAGFLTIDRAIQLEKEMRGKRRLEQMPVYGNFFLTDCLLGILPSEVVVIGADAGVGKTQLVNDLAFKNAYEGRRVYLFSLEGDKNEVITRAKWQIICQQYFKNPSNKSMSFQKFQMNAIDGIEDLEAYAEKQLMRIRDNLFIYDRKEDLDLPTLCGMISKIDKADLVIIDHLHYMNLSDEKNEASQLTEIMKAVMKIAEFKGIPFVIVSHLKPKSRERHVLPDNNDFFGSSNIAKIATTCITVSPWHDLDERDLSATMFRITKSRGGAQKKFIGNVFYNIQQRKYEQNYTLHYIKKGDLQLVSNEDYPSWARVASNFK